MQETGVDGCRLDQNNSITLFLRSGARDGKKSGNNVQSDRLESSLSGLLNVLSWALISKVAGQPDVTQPWPCVNLCKLRESETSSRDIQ
jgi:hypothetical protein